MFGWQAAGRFSDSEEEYEKWHEKAWQKELADSDDSNDSDESLPEPPSKRRKTEDRFKYNPDDNDDDDKERDCKYKVLDYELAGTTLKIRNCSWRIDGFEGTDVVEKKAGSIRSDLYVSGPSNAFQFYLIMHNQVTEDDTQYGVYACVLSNTKGKLHFESMILDHKGGKSLLDKKKSECPKKTGLHFLGYLSKERIIEDDYYNCSYLGEGHLDLAFKVDVDYKNLDEVTYLEKLFEKNSVKDIEVIVKGKKFPANKKILSQSSETFAKLLQKNKKIEINDIDPNVMKSILHYIHTRKVPKLFNYASKISAAAEKYKLKDLKAMCNKIQN